MRLNDFYQELRSKFTLTLDWDLAHEVASAMTAAQNTGSGTFSHDGKDYIITAVWLDQCISYNCNPATCYTDWNLTEVPHGA